MSSPGTASDNAPPVSLVTPAAFIPDDCSNGDDQHRPEHGQLAHPQPELEHERHQRIPSDSASSDDTRAAAGSSPARRTSNGALHTPPKRAITTPLPQLWPSRASSTVVSSSAFRSQTPQLSERDSIFATHYLPSDNNDGSVATTPILLSVRGGTIARNADLTSTLGEADILPSDPASRKVLPSSDSSTSTSSHHSRSTESNDAAVPRPIVTRPTALRRASDVLVSSSSTTTAAAATATTTTTTAPLAGSHVGWVRQQETVESSKVAGKHRIAIRETFHPLRKIVSEGTDTDAPVSQDSDRGLLPSVAGDQTRLDHIPMVRPSFPDHEIALAEPWTASRHLKHGEGTVDVTWDTKMNRSASQGRSTRVEESIEANLANAEPASHVRSRKSSHYLGLFKENTTSPDRKRREDRGRNLETGEIAEEPENMPHAVEAVGDPQSTPRPSNAKLHLPLTHKDNHQAFDPLEAPREDKTQPYHPSQEYTRVETIEVEAANDTSSRSSRLLPRNLLEEIRNFHLTSGGSRGGSFSRSIPTRYTERGRKNVEDVYGSQSPEDDGTSRQDGQPSSLPEEEDDEHISSALYFPHERKTGEAGASFAQYRQDKDDYTLLDDATLEVAESEASAHVDISFRSRGDSSTLHGEFQPINDVEEKALATISEYGHESTSESEAASESGLSTHDDLSSLTDDAELTPMATLAQSGRNLRPRRKHTKTGPIGAVELKPYRHQVGGHTTVFRFSRRAVCKQLNNRENEFYERIERRHPEMLVFLPRLALSCFIGLFHQLLVNDLPTGISVF